MLWFLWRILYNYCMKNLKNVIANNLIYLRKKNNLTQMEIASRINYSDNAISRWERGDVTPSIENLEILADFYQIEVKDLLDENLSLKQEENAVPQTASRILTVIFSISIVWLIIIIAYIYRQMIVDTNDWLLFVAGAPISSLVAFYFNRKWGNKVLSIIISSLFVWSLIATVYLYYLSYNMWPLFLLGLPCQAAIITGFFLKGTRK